MNIRSTPLEFSSMTANHRIHSTAQQKLPFAHECQSENRLTTRVRPARVLLSGAPPLGVVDTLVPLDWPAWLLVSYQADLPQPWLALGDAFLRILVKELSVMPYPIHRALVRMSTDRYRSDRATIVFHTRPRLDPVHRARMDELARRLCLLMTALPRDSRGSRRGSWAQHIDALTEAATSAASTWTTHDATPMETRTELCQENVSTMAATDLEWSPAMTPEPRCMEVFSGLDISLSTRSALLY